MSKDLPECDAEVFEKGTTIHIDALPSGTMESLIVAVRPYLREGVKLDWHMFGGRNVVKVLVT